MDAGKSLHLTKRGHRMDAKESMHLTKRRRTVDMPLPVLAKESSHENGDAVEDVNVVQWSELPDDTITKIQAQLPVVSLLRSSAVCRAWKEAVDVASPFLLRERKESGAGASDLMLFAAGFSSFHDVYVDSCAYDPASNRWYKLDLPRPLLSRAVQWMQLMGLSSTSKGGGVLLSAWQTTPSQEISNMVLHIGNPVARSWTVLRPPAFGPIIFLRRWYVRGMFVDAKTGCFKVVWVERKRLLVDPRNLDAMPCTLIFTLVFDSALGSWSETISEWPATTTSYHSGYWDSMHDGVFVGTVLYCLDDYCNLLSYDLERASWRWLVVAKPAQVKPVHILFCDVINVRDRLLCAVVLRLRSQGQPQLSDRALEIWELDFARMTWKIVDIMPAPMFARAFEYHGIDSAEPQIKVVAGQNEVYFALNNLDNVAALDLRPTSRAWRWLPSYPYEHFEVTTLQCLDPWLELGNSKLG